MNDETEMFAGFDLLQPARESSDAAVEKVRGVIIEAAGGSDHAINGTVVSPQREAVPQQSWWRSSALAAVVTVVLAGVVWLAISRDRSVMAQAIRQMELANSIKCVSEVSLNGEDWMKAFEFLYDRDLGTISRWYDRDSLNRIDRIDRDDGKTHWVYREGNHAVTRERSHGKKRQMERLLEPLSRNREYVHQPADDKVIDGERCRHYFIEDKEHGYRVSIWIDPEGRLRHATDCRTMSDSTIISRTHVEYDLEIEPNAFISELGQQAKVIDLSTVFDESCSLNEAIHQENRFGYELAVHQLKRTGDFEYFMLLSFRPSEQLRQKLQLQRGETPGSIHPGARYSKQPLAGMIIDQPPRESEDACLLAEAEVDGVTMLACLCRLSGGMVPPPERAQPQFGIFLHSKLWKNHNAHQDVVLDVELPTEIVPLIDVIRSTYDMIAALEQIPMRTVNLHDELDERMLTRRQDMGGGMIQESRGSKRPRPSDIDFETFYDHILNAPWRRTRTKQDYEKEVVKWQEDFGPRDPLIFLKTLEPPGAERGTMWQQRLTAILQLPDPPVQKAALGYASRVRSLRFLYPIQKIIEETEHDDVRIAAERTLKLYRRPVESGDWQKDWPPADFPAAAVEQLIANLQTNTNVALAIKGLREFTRLDFGDGQSESSRKRWAEWWKFEQAAIETAAGGKREFLVYGETVTRRKPVAGAPVEIWIEKHLFSGDRGRAAQTISDDNGRYILRFGFIGDKPDFPIVQLKIGSPIQGKLDEEWSDWGLVSRYEFDDDPVTGKPKSRFVFSGRPKKRNVGVKAGNE